MISIEQASIDERLNRGALVIEALALTYDEEIFPPDEQLMIWPRNMWPDDTSLKSTKVHTLIKRLVEAEKVIGTIYRIAHYINSPKCIKNHPEWLKEIETLEKEFKEHNIMDVEKHLNDHVS
jgi:hypothetical protein